jgi:hypothetical protein
LLLRVAGAICAITAASTAAGRNVTTRMAGFVFTLLLFPSWFSTGASEPDFLGVAGNNFS